MATVIEPFLDDDLSDISVGGGSVSEVLDDIADRNAIFEDCETLSNETSHPQGVTLARFPEATSISAAITTVTSPAFLRGGPRLVSWPSMSRFTDKSNSKRPSSSLAASYESTATPYEDLKELIQSKKKKRRMQCMTVISDEDDHLASVQTATETPRALHLQLPGFQANCERPIGPDHTHVSDPLHYACARGNDDDIQHLLRHESSTPRFLVATPKQVFTTKLVYNMGTYQMETKPNVPESYTYPLHLAIRNPNVQHSKTLRVLLEAAPQVLAMPDGNAMECPLSVLLKNPSTKNDAGLVAEFLKAFPDSVGMVDRKGNSPLHIACQYGANLDTVQKLVDYVSPQAMLQSNHLGETPLSIAQRAIHQCSDAIAMFLWHQQAVAL